MLLTLVDDTPITTITIPTDCICSWYGLGARPWELTIAMANCPHHGWIDRTELDIRPVLDWLMSGWIIEPPKDLVRDVTICRRPGWLPAAAFAWIAERVVEHATPCWLWPIVRVVATAQPASTCWPPEGRLSAPLLAAPRIPEGSVLP